MGHDIEAVRAKAEASFRKSEQIAQTDAARAEKDVREQIERLRQLRLAKAAGCRDPGEAQTRGLEVSAGY